MIVGIDTSCYTTSIALVNEAGEVVLNSRKLLEVKQGEKGLRQSEAVFQHIQNLPQLLEHPWAGEPVSMVVVSKFPRPAANSYLPVFSVGASFGETLAKICGAAFHTTSHQEGHIRAGLSGQRRPREPFLAWHISGGTSELLLVQPQTAGFAITKVGGSTDLHVGQFVDRIGVALGASFPAGPFLERLALQAEAGRKVHLPVAVQGKAISFSGPESAAQRMLQQGSPGAEIAREVFSVISRSVWQVTLQAVREFKVHQVWLVGGVAANSLIRQELQAAGNQAGVAVHFGPTALSSDNAVGTALIGWDLLHPSSNEVTKE